MNAARPPGTLARKARDARSQIVGLDLIRGLSAFLVLCFHLGFWIWRCQVNHPPTPRAYAPFAPLSSKGWVGVEIFFVISGFVIAYSSEGATPARFLQHRVKRLMPAALFCSTMTAAVLLTAYPLREVSIEWLRSVVFFPVGPWVDGSFWTLPIEVAFYTLVFTNLALRPGRSLAPVMAVLGAASTAACLLVLLAPKWVPGPVLAFVSASGFPPLACLLLIHGVFFSLGTFLFLSLVHGVTRSGIASLILCTVGCVAELVWHDRGVSFATGTQPGWILPLCLWGGAVVAMAAATRWNGAVQDVIGKQGMRVTRQIGVATYPFYLLHDKVGQVAIGGLHRKVGYGAALVLAALFVAGAAVFIAQVLEPPTRRVMDLFLTKITGAGRPLTAARG